MKRADGRMPRRLWAAAIGFAAIAAAALVAERTWRPDLRGVPLLDEPGFHAAIGVLGAAGLTILAAALAALTALFQQPRNEQGGGDGDQP
jgi:hypothetical protein